MPSRSAPRRFRARAITASVAILVCGIAAVGCSASPPQHSEAVSPDTADTAANPESVRVTNLTVPGWASADEVSGATEDEPNRTGSEKIPVRQYEPSGKPWAVLVWAHGGSFLAGDLDGPEPDWVARQFAALGIRVYTVDYVLASDTVKAPAPANDVAAVLGWAGEQSELPLAVGGASAGGQLAGYAALERNLAARGQHSAASGHPGRGVARALLLEYPTLHRVQREDPEVAALVKDLPDAKREDADLVAQMYDYYLGPVSDADVASKHLVMGELPAGTLRALPPTVIVNAEADDLRPSGEEFADQLTSAGVRVATSLQADTTHGYLSFPEDSPEAVTASTETMNTLAAGLRAIVE
nr:alpha/beta hydrolase fold domain-containing protein [Leucobacter edaphi]